MQIVNGAIGCLLIVLAGWHLATSESNSVLTAAFLGGAVLAFATLVFDMNTTLARLLAICTTGAMFYYFAAFFLMLPGLQEFWFSGQQAIEAIGLLIAAFAMIPVLSDYSCRLKAECRDARQRKRRAFFTVPQNLENHSVRS